jgi:hypothetical protein
VLTVKSLEFFGGNYQLQIEDNEILLLSATACAWIAAKLEDSCISHLASIRVRKERVSKQLSTLLEELFVTDVMWSIT